MQQFRVFSVLKKVRDYDGSEAQKSTLFNKKKKNHTNVAFLKSVLHFTPHLSAEMLLSKH